MLEKAVQIPYGTYQRLADYLAAHEATDGWSKTLLDELEEEKKVIELDEKELGKQEARNRFEKHFDQIDKNLTKAALDSHKIRSFHE